MMIGFIDHSKKALAASRRHRDRKQRRQQLRKQLPMAQKRDLLKDCDDIADYLLTTKRKDKAVPTTKTVWTRRVVHPCLVPGCKDEVILTRGQCFYHYNKSMRFIRQGLITEESLVVLLAIEVKSLSALLICGK